MPEGVNHTAQFLADGDGEVAGILLPGESGRMPVYYTGMLQPWDYPDGHLLSPTCGRGQLPHPLMILTRDEEKEKYWSSGTYHSSKVKI